MILHHSLVIIPTYNEIENAGNIIRAVMDLDPGFDVLVIDDGSPDGTGDLVEGLTHSYPGRLHLIRRQGKLGLGTAYIAGFRWGLQRDYRFFFEMDADFSHAPADLLRLQEACSREDTDLVVGSRYIPGGKFVNWPFIRIFISYGASLYVRLITGLPVKDPTAGFICYKRRVLEAIDLDQIRFIGYAFQIEMKFAAFSLGFRIREIPITFTDRVEGNSKMSGKIVQEAIVGVLRMRWKSFFHSYGH